MLGICDPSYFDLIWNAIFSSKQIASPWNVFVSHSLGLKLNHHLRGFFLLRFPIRKQHRGQAIININIILCPGEPRFLIRKCHQRRSSFRFCRQRKRPENILKGAEGGNCKCVISILNASIVALGTELGDPMDGGDKKKHFATAAIRPSTSDLTQSFLHTLGRNSRPCCGS